MTFTRLANLEEKKTSRSSGHSSWDFVFDEEKCQASIKKA